MRNSVCRSGEIGCECGERSAGVATSLAADQSPIDLVISLAARLSQISTNEKRLGGELDVTPSDLRGAGLSPEY
jgi:hypothetical protein